MPQFEKSQSPSKGDETAPAKTFFLASDSEGRQIVSIHVKQLFRLHEDGFCEGGDADQPLLLGDELDEDMGFSESDVVPFKENTDFIVMTKAWAHGAKTVQASIRVGNTARYYNVTGDRRVLYHGAGSWGFSEPEPFESMAMSYANAYGGIDETVPEHDIEHIADMFTPHPGMYPRNPAGKGYAVYDNKERLDGLLLPNIEHPNMMLKPENLLVGHPHKWWQAPLPWCCEWYGKTWYPRIVYYRGCPDGLPKDDTEVEEVKAGWLRYGSGKDLPLLNEEHPYDNKVGDAASPALVMPTMRGDEVVELTNMTKNGRINIRLPGKRPRVLVRYKGSVQEVSVVPHRIVVSTLEMGVYMVWHAAWYPPRILPDRALGIDASMAAAVQGVEVFIDGQTITPLRSPT